MTSQSLGRKSVQLSGAGVGLDLTVPSFGIELAEPLTESGTFLSGEGTHFVLDLFESVHENLFLASDSRKCTSGDSRRPTSGDANGC